LIYSQWLPDRGGYAYYAAAERRGLGDDLPTPRLKDVSTLGVASTEIGRPLPLGSKIVGYGPLARGSIVPFDRRGLSGVPTTGSLGAVVLGALGLAAAIAGALLVRRLR
jgi:hypothetical protein